jgi:hypothetical protein
MTGVHEREGDDDDQTSVPWRVAHDPPRPTSRPVPASSMWCPEGSGRDRALLALAGCVAPLVSLKNERNWDKYIISRNLVRDHPPRHWRW